ncbi:tetratricopeptide repeat protein [Cytobacillus firmus]|uniref:Tetratricopeptide repeat protein n=2 Tax=Cytobacillus TaxID=2675230 RepID=A0A366K482_CYTFI|nr:MULTISPECIES: tetratricopeptide repeat protein [Cytobacillus]RBP95923.1 tetratricopeptide repeat protein [Cytobacillus firmus]TDX44836.1 tetratricopeptide repeat protein [Cytobacillus oceanisediminis]
MSTDLEKAIVLRNLGKYKDSSLLLVKLAEEYPVNPVIHYQCAWSFDVLGEESKAVSHYEKAIELGLPESDLPGAILGLGSTYRTLGEYEKSKMVFEKGISQFPANRAIQVFYSMTLHNLGKHSEAMEMLLRCVAETSDDPEVMQYKKAITFYADKLDEIFDKD